MTRTSKLQGCGIAAAAALLTLLACGRADPAAGALRVSPGAPLPATGTDERTPAVEPPALPAVPMGGLATLVASLPGHTAVAPRPSLPDPGARGAGGAKPFVPRLTGRTADGAEILEFPLAHTRVVAQVSGNVARVEVTQFYVNPSPDRLEAVYAFPLPPNAAVTDMMFRVGNRVVLSEVKRREEAKRTYETAKKEGRTAALTEQERPNLFTQSVANVPPGDTCTRSRTTTGATRSTSRPPSGRGTCPARRSRRPPTRARAGRRTRIGSRTRPA
jgi:hypothetical protein